MQQSLHFVPIFNTAFVCDCEVEILLQTVCGFGMDKEVARDRAVWRSNLDEMIKWQTKDS